MKKLFTIRISPISISRWATTRFLLSMLSLSSYHHFVLLIVTSLLLAGVIALASFTLQSATRTAEKVSTYECGFEPMSDARQEFDVKFFVVALLFIVFDLEIAYLFPCTLR
eukprot:Opistho-1_new@41173